MDPQLQWPMRDPGYVEVRTQQLEPIARIPIPVVEALIAHHLDGIAMQAYLSESLLPDWREKSAPTRIEMARKPLALARRAVDDSEQRAELRAKRRSRRRA